MSGVLYKMERAMDQRLNRVYIAHNQIICSLGVTTEQVFGSVEGYKTNLSYFEDGTPLCTVDSSALNFDDLQGYTFVEQLAISALRDVQRKSTVKISSERTALIISTTKGNIDRINDDFQRSYLWELGDKISGFFERTEAPIIVSNACVSGVAAIAVGARMIECGEVDNVYVVGVDIASEFVVSGFNSFKSVSPTLCRPYDESRDGLTIGEGCGALLLTNNRELSASKILVTGYALSCDANHISGPSRSGDGLFYATRRALKMAGLKSSDIDFINTHGTATPYNDEMESKALNLAGLCSVPCNSLKPYIGHTLGAAGVIETILSVEAMSQNKVFGVKGFEKSGVPFELNIDGSHREIKISHSLKCASGFGGTNGAIVLSKEGDYVMSERREIEKSEIVECGSIHLYKDGGELTSSEELKVHYKELGEANLKFYKMSSLAKLGYVASSKLLCGVELPFESERVAVVLASSSGSLDADILHQKNVDKKLPEGTSPAIFVYTLANIVAAEIAIKHKFQGESMTFILEKKDMDFISGYAEGLINNNECDAVLYGWCELLEEKYETELKLIWSYART